jgi:T5SS/PEP-CTERM-associated repeat protein
MKHSTSAARRLAGISLAIAAAWPPLPAQAQYFTSSGSVFTWPTSFPINPAAPVLDFTGYALWVGDAAPGSFTAQAGALLRADALQIGSGTTGNGSATFTGAGTLAQFGGPNNRLDIGNWGTGSLTVSAGAVVDASINPGACGPGFFCNSMIGGGAGSNGTMTVTGAGSEVRTLRNFIVGQAAVFTQANDGFDFGTPGGTTTAAVNVLNGGTLRTQGVQAGVGPYAGSSALGTEQVFTTILVDGAASRWLATRNTVDNTAASFIAGSGTGGNANITVRNGGQLIVDGAGGASTGFDSLVIGTNGGQAQLTVTGVGSVVRVQGNNPNITLGINGGQGTMSVLAGATAAALYMNVGRGAGSSGALTVDGAGSVLALSGVGMPSSNGSGGMNVGREGSTGQVTVSGGGQILIDDGGGNSSGGNASPFMNIARDAGSFGTLSITGPGSLVQITSTSIAPSPGLPDNFNPFVAVGRFAGATGALTVSDGGQLVLQGNALSTPGLARGTTLTIGGNNGASAGGTGTVTVTGAGSAIRLQGSDALIGVGRGAGGNGTLNVSSQGSVASTSLWIGETGGTGTVNLNNGTIALGGVRTDIPNLGAGMTVGAGSNANGQLNLANGSLFTITNNAISGGMSIGGDQFVADGSGSGASSGVTT